VNVTEEPEQVGLFPDVMAMLIAGVTVLITFIVMPEELTVAGLAQAAEEVIVQLITSPLLRAEEVNIEAFSPPIGVPLRFH
jgi:hypothetical protein